MRGRLPSETMEADAGMAHFPVTSIPANVGRGAC